MAAEIGADLTASLVNLDSADVRRLARLHAPRPAPSPSRHGS
jgi:hypothetical protein